MSCEILSCEIHVAPTAVIFNSNVFEEQKFPRVPVWVEKILLLNIYSSKMQHLR